MGVLIFQDWHSLNIDIKHSCEFKNQNNEQCGKLSHGKFCLYHERVLTAVKAFIAEKVDSINGVPAVSDIISLIDDSTQGTPPLVETETSIRKRSMSECSQRSTHSDRGHQDSLQLALDLSRFKKRKNLGERVRTYSGSDNSDSGLPPEPLSPTRAANPKTSRFKYLRGVSTMGKTTDLLRSGLPPTVRKLLEKKQEARRERERRISQSESGQSESESESNLDSRLENIRPKITKRFRKNTEPSIVSSASTSSLPSNITTVPTTVVPSDVPIVSSAETQQKKDVVQLINTTRVSGTVEKLTDTNNTAEVSPLREQLNVYLSTALNTTDQNTDSIASEEEIDNSMKVDESLAEGQKDSAIEEAPVFSIPKPVEEKGERSESPIPAPPIKKPRTGRLLCSIHINILSNYVLFQNLLVSAL